MAANNKRDLHADLAICDAATPGPWKEGTSEYESSGGVWCVDIVVLGVTAEVYEDENATFIVESRQGWPEAIRRAIAAEAESERLREALIEIAWRGYDEGLSAYFYSPENHARCVDIARDVLLK